MRPRVGAGVLALASLASCTTTVRSLERVQVALDARAGGDCARACDAAADRYECLGRCPGAEVLDGACAGEPPATAVACEDRVRARSVVSKKRTVIVIVAVPVAIFAVVTVGAWLIFASTPTH